MKIKVRKHEDLKKILILNGYSQRGLARKLGMSEPYINQIVNGERNPSPKLAKEIAEALKVGFDEIFEVYSDNKSEHQRRNHFEFE